MPHDHFVYIIANDQDAVLYIRVSNDLLRRVSEHRASANSGFTSRCNVDKPVFLEGTCDVVAAIAREKHIKRGSRRRKIVLIDAMNPDWRDLYDDLL